MRLFLAFLFFIFGNYSPSQELDYVFKSGDYGYKCFRIPTIIKSKSGLLLAFAEGRKNSCSDTGDIDLVLRKSNDNGKSWSDLSVIWDDDENTAGNPSPVLDEISGRIILLSTWNLGTDHEWEIINKTSYDHRRIFQIISDDEGETWSIPKEITQDVKLDNWTWYATGPVNGIQLKRGKNKGRLIIPCDHIEAFNKRYYSHVIFSDDGGLNWKLGGSTLEDDVNECTVVELNNGNLLLNMRNYTDDRYRKQSISTDQGISWNTIYSNLDLQEPVCQASMISSNKKLLFSNPDSKTAREKMTVKISIDKGKKWTELTTLHEGPSAYSNLIKIDKNIIGCLFEAGLSSPYEGIVFQKFKLNP